MEKRLQTGLLVLLLSLLMGFGQTYSQYFYGADTSAFNSIFVAVDTAASNVWQIGQS